MFWHVYLFNLFILTSSDYNWQQRAELTLGSVLDVSVTIMRKACEDKVSEEATIAGVWFSHIMASLTHMKKLEYALLTDFNAAGSDPGTAENTSSAKII